MNRLGLVLGTADDLGYVVGLARAASARGIEVRLFAMHDGAAALTAPAVATLVEVGCEIVACATTLARRGLEAPAAVVRGSQDDHAALCAWADRVVAFT